MDKETKYKIAGQVLKANEDGSIRFRLITDDVDRDSEVLLPLGARVANWKVNPAWLWVHNSEAWGGKVRPPIGKINPNTIEQTEHFLDNDVIFDEKNDEFAKMIAAKHRDGFLNASSVGFIPITISSDTVKPDQKGVTHKEFEVLEGSSVPIPANPAALQQREWGEFVDSCRKYGFGNINMKAWMKMAGWTAEQIKDSLPNDNLTMVIPYDKETVTATQNYEITEIPPDGETEIKKPDDSEAVVEIDQEEKIGISIDEISKAMKTLIGNGMTEDEAEAAIIKVVKRLAEPPKKEENTYKLIIDELNSINQFSKPDITDKTLTLLKQMKP